MRSLPMIVLITVVSCSFKVAAVDPRYSEKPATGTLQTPVRGRAPSPNIISPARTVEVGPSQPPSALPGFGAKIYATGAGDVIVKVKPVPRRWLDEVYLVSGTTNKYLGSNWQATTITNLGKLPAGEILLMMKVRETPGRQIRETGIEYFSGPAIRNPDQQAHATVNVIGGGAIEVRWEDRYFRDWKEWIEGTGTASEVYALRQLWFTDLCVELSGGVTIDAGSSGHSAAVDDLVQVIKEQKGEVRAAALAALKKIDPAAARQFPPQ